MNLLEPHHFGSVDLTSLGLIIALYCAIINSLGNLFGPLLLVVMASLAGLAIANTHCAIILALLGHGVALFHFCFLSALIELCIIYLWELYIKHLTNIIKCVMIQIKEICLTNSYLLDMGD